MARHISFYTLLVVFCVLLSCKARAPVAEKVTLAFMDNDPTAPTSTDYLNYFERDEIPYDITDYRLFRIHVSEPEFHGRNVTLKIRGAVTPLADDIAIDPNTGYSGYLAIRDSGGDSAHSETVSIEGTPCRFFYINEPMGILLEASIGKTRTLAAINPMDFMFFSEQHHDFRSTPWLPPFALIPQVRITSMSENADGSLRISGTITDCLHAVSTADISVVDSDGMLLDVDPNPAKLTERENPPAGPFVSEFTDVVIPKELFRDGENTVSVTTRGLRGAYGWQNITVKAADGKIVEKTLLKNNYDDYYSTQQPTSFYVQAALATDVTELPKNLYVTVTVETNGNVFDKKRLKLAQLQPNGRFYRSAPCMYAEVGEDFKERPAELSDDVQIIFGPEMSSPSRVGLSDLSENK
jgi:hypothetical protein